MTRKQTVRSGAAVATNPLGGAMLTEPMKVTCAEPRARLGASEQQFSLLPFQERGKATSQVALEESVADAAQTSRRGGSRARHA